MGRKQNKLLIIGGVPYNERPASFGGTTVLMQNFLEYCQKVGIPYDFVSTNRYGGRMSAIRNLMQMFCGLLRYVWRCDCIMYNASSLTGPYLIYPIIFIIGNCWGKSWCSGNLQVDLKIILSNIGKCKKLFYSYYVIQICLSLKQRN